MNIIKNSIKLSLILLLGNVCTYATTWETVEKGFWTDSTIWLNGVVPNTTSSDTFYIKHPIVISQDLTFNSEAYVQIETEGGICGHHKTTVLKNATIINYGILELDDLHVNGGYVHCFAGKVLLTTSAKIEGLGGKMIIDNIGSLTVGIWFDCVLPNYAFLSDGKLYIQEKAITAAYTVFPNPFSNSLTILNDDYNGLKADQTLKVDIYDYLGRLVLETPLFDYNSNSLDVSSLKQGIYKLHITSENNIFSTTIVKN